MLIDGNVSNFTMVACCIYSHQRDAKIIKSS